MKVTIWAETITFRCRDCGCYLKTKRDGREYLYHPIRVGFIFKRDSPCFNAGRSFHWPEIELQPWK